MQLVKCGHAHFYGTGEWRDRVDLDRACVYFFQKKQAVRRLNAAYHVDVSYFGEWCH